MKRKNDETERPEEEEAEPAAPEGTAAAGAGAETDAASAQIEQLRERVLELTAEIDNQAKRFGRERQVVRDEIAIRFAREMVEVLDNLDLVLKSLSEEERATPLGRGVVLTQVVFLDKLKGLGIEPVEASGRPFDPAWHEAIFQTERADRAPGTVLSELTRGYRMGDKLVRAAKVEVARAPAAAADPAGDDADAAANGAGSSGGPR